MPIYCYRCPACKHEIETVRPFNADGVPVCTECNRLGRPDSEMVKVPTAAAVVVNGFNAANGYSNR